MDVDVPILPTQLPSAAPTSAARLAAARAGPQRPLASATAAERAGDGAGQAAGWHGGGVGDRALHVAARRGDVEMVAMLLMMTTDGDRRPGRRRGARTLFRPS